MFNLPSLTSFGILTGGILLIFAAMGATIGLQRHEIGKLKAEHAQFVLDTKVAGEIARRKVAESIANNERVNNETIKSLEARNAELDAKYDRLRHAKTDTRGSGMPAVPDTARPVDDTARDSRLLDLLQRAESQTGQLIELQQWIREHTMRVK